MKISQHFHRAEFACSCGCGFDTVDTQLLEILELVRTHFKSPISINSGARCAKHNKAVGGSPRSQHLLGRAADIAVKGVDPESVAGYADLLLGDAGGVGQYRTFVHIDSRNSKARWNG